MSRKGNTPTRELRPDPKHGSLLISRFINMVMQSGKKSVAEGIVYGAIDHCVRSIVSLAAAIIVSLGIAVLSWTLIEKPYLRRKRSTLRVLYDGSSLPAPYVRQP